MKDTNIPIDYIINPETWQKRYDIHKYWGKKPSNVVSEYINYFTDEGDIVADLFSGFGVTVIEAVVNKRKGIGVDINPISKYICKSLIEEVDLEKVNEIYKLMKKELNEKMNWIYSTNCPNCNYKCKVMSTVWKDDEPTEVKYKCNNCNGKGTKVIDIYDLNLINEINSIKIPFWYPKDDIFKGWQTKKLLKKGLQNFSEIYTHRNLYAISCIFDKIIKINDLSIRRIFIVAFTSMIAQGSKMIANYKGKSGGPSWKINTFWLPGNSQELNVWHYFDNRMKKMIKGKNEIDSLIDHPEYDFYSLSSTNLRSVIDSESVDYIFTDPPYGGEGIQYLELSFLWNSWLSYFDEKIDWNNEVVYNPFRDKKLTDQNYEEKLQEVFEEAYRILKPNSWMSVTFANKDLKIWNSLIRSLKKSGFNLINIIPMEASAPNITQMLLKGAPKSDLIINLKKSYDQLEWGFHKEFNFDELTSLLADKTIKKDGKVSLSNLFDLLLIEWFTIKYSEINSDEQIIEFDKNKIEKFMNSNKKYKLIKNLDEANNLRKKADCEWVFINTMI